MTPAEKLHLYIVRLATGKPLTSQRQLAQRLRASLGKINYVLKALLHQGSIKEGNSLRADAKRK